MILNIETSGPRCSVALCHEGENLVMCEDDQPMNHAVKLAPFVDRCMEQLRRHEGKLDAVAVSIGPGSYTGLRIGLSTAKGLAYGLNVPLIAVETLKVLAVKAIFSSTPLTGEEIIIPMTDARRMEVYTAGYDFSLSEVLAPQPLILDSESYAPLLETHRCVFIGSGVAKAKEVITSPNAIWIENAEPHALDMMALSDLYFRQKKFADTAYSTPLYLKEYQTTTPKPKI